MTAAVLSPAAERDFLEIIAWIASDNPLAARGFRAALEKQAIAIGEHPLVGSLKPHIASPPIRFLPVRSFPHIIVYTPDPTPPLILRILHGARDIPELLRDL